MRRNEAGAIRWAKQCKQRRDRTALIDLMHGLNQHMTYTPGSTEVDTSAAQAFAGRSGVCQDHTHAFLARARSLGIAARYVSGYLYSESSEQLASHAWADTCAGDFGATTVGSGIRHREQARSHI